MNYNPPYLVIAYYCFVAIEDPEIEVAKHHSFFKGRDIKSRIYISKQGINAQMSAFSPDGHAYMEWLKEDPRFGKVDFKIHFHREHVFPRPTVKVREQLVALEVEVDPSEGGERVSPQVWREMLEEEGDKKIVLDVRNGYEWKVGHFEGAILPDLETFREFPAYVKQLKKQHNPEETKVMMYCTGGIRCELYSALMKKEGFQNVYQLDGGVIKYGLEEGAKHWRGKLFVFDDRLTIPIDPEAKEEIIGKCHHCGSSSDVYYNCANMDCNELFLCCPSCAEQSQGCCSTACLEAPRLRPYEKSQSPKPFRRWYHYTQTT